MYGGLNYLQLRELHYVAMRTLRQIADSKRKTVAQRNAQATVEFIETQARAALNKKG